MSDHADKLRDILELTDCSRGQWEPLLDAVEAERDEARQSFKLWFARYKEERARAEAAEAKLVVDAYRLLAAEAALRAAEAERDEARGKVLTHTEALLALKAERDRWRAVACNVKDGTAAARKA